MIYENFDFLLWSSDTYKDLPVTEQRERTNDLWRNLVWEYEKLYAHVQYYHAPNREPSKRTRAFIRRKLHRDWFRDRIIRVHNWMHETKKYNWFDIKESTRKRYTEFFERIMHKIEREVSDSIYFYSWGRDWDLGERDDVHRFRNWYEAAEWITAFGESAEGPQSLRQINLEEYLMFERETRDRGLEIFEEYGYGY